MDILKGRRQELKASIVPPEPGDRKNMRAKLDDDATAIATGPVPPCRTIGVWLGISDE